MQYSGRRSPHLALAAALGALALAGCGSSAAPATPFTSTTAANEAAGGAGGSRGGGGGGGTDEVAIDAGGGHGDGGLEDGGACAAQATKGQLRPLDMLIMLDRSKSMDESGKWTAVTAGIGAFMADPLAAGIGVGLQYFGIPGGSYGKDTCDVASYATAAVPIAALPGNAGAIASSLAQNSPSTWTPTGPALQGAIQYASQWAQANPEHATVVVFATDGDPTECSPQDPAAIAQFAAHGLTGSPSIKTYVIGMQGATTANLDQWAAAGGTTAAYDASDPSKFITALNAIRGAALACEYLVPVPAEGELDFGLVNVDFKANGETTALVQVPNAASCDPQAGGWYYDDPQAPKHIEICGATCEAFKAASQVPGADPEVDVLLGCKTVTAVPK